ncbi:cysteine proteinase [Xylariaceae sp. FL1651]|nr:cysteine proteinase [Xylariaceae sp. FL1651]
MSIVALPGTTVLLSSGIMTSSANDFVNGASGTGVAGRGAHSGNFGPGKAPFRHIDDIVSVSVDLDPHTPLRKVLEIGDAHMQQAISYSQFRRPDLALQEYIRAFTIAVDKVPKHKEYPSLKSDRGGLNRLHHALKVKITNNGATFEKIKEAIKEDNLRSGVRPTTLAATSSNHLLLNLPSVPSSVPLQHSTDGRDTVQMDRKPKPTVHPKPQALHGNSIKPPSDKGSSDLAARFAKLRDSQESRICPSPVPSPNPIGSSYQPPLSVNSSVPTMPKVPDAIYSPARGTTTSEVANLPSSTPRGMFSRTNSIVSLPSTSSRMSMESAIRSFNGEQFVAAHTYGESQGSSSTTKLRIPRGDSITVKDLVRCMNHGDANVKILLIDVRDRQSFDEGHIMSQRTICLDPTILSRENISAEEIVDSMILAPPKEKLAFEQRDKVDLVVFYDQDSESMPKKISGDIQEMVLYNVQQALAHFSYPKQLSHAPKLLVGGLDAWVDEMGEQSLETSSTQAISSSATSTSVSTRQRLRNRTLKPDEVNVIEAMIGRDKTGQFDYARTRDEFMRRFPSVAEPESMTSDGGEDSSVQSSNAEGEEFLKDITPTPPIRPKPSVARTRYSGLESTDEHSAPGGLAMMANPQINLRGNRVPTGLVNPGNWCYSNASLQALLVSPGFVDEFLDTQWPTKYRPNVPAGNPSHNQLMCKILGNLLQWLSKRYFRTMKTTTLMHYLRSIHTGYRVNGNMIRFGDNSQHDSDEFITFIFGQLGAETRIELTKNPLPTLDLTKPVDFAVHEWGNRSVYHIIHRHWHLMEIETYTCNTCRAQNFISADGERYQLPVPHEHDKGTLEEQIRDHFAAEERIEAKCDNCESLGKIVTRQIVRLPPLLRVQLQRSDPITGNKVMSRLRFPFDNFDLHSYALDARHRSAIAKMLGGEAAEGFDVPTQYNLYAVVVHAGSSPNSGHYISYVKGRDGKWTQCNDTYIREQFDDKRFRDRLYDCARGYTPVQLYYKRIDVK